VNSIEEQRLLFSQIMDLLEHHFGPQCEIVLHDNTKDYAHTIIDIRNGQISGRQIGDGGGAWGLEVLSSEQTESHRYNKVMVTDDGRIIRNSSIFFQNEQGQNIGSLCLNTDITPLVEAQKKLDSFTLLPQEENNGGKEPFTNDVNQILELLLQECRKHMDKPAKDMNKEEKMEIVRFLDHKGAFLITKSGDKICSFLDISKFTLYSYLDTIRKEGTDE
jgi:predicted transcriptional regulator YheO